MTPAQKVKALWEERQVLLAEAQQLLAAAARELQEGHITKAARTHALAKSRESKAQLKLDQINRLTQPTLF